MKFGFRRAVFLVLVLRMVSAPVAYRPSGSSDQVAPRYVLRVCHWHPGSSTQKLSRRLPSAPGEFDQRRVAGDFAARAILSKQSNVIVKQWLSDDQFEAAYSTPLRC
jgi:hypothetical protein